MTERGAAGSGTGWYVYGVVPAAAADEEIFEDVAGVAGGPVTMVDGGTLAAIASEVPLSEFGEEAIADRLRDPEWLEGRVRAHERVLETALAAIPVVPFRFGTIYHGAEGVRAMLDGDGRLAAALDRVRGRVELGVKGFLEATAAGAEPKAEPASAGRQYLEAKQRERRLAEEADALRAELAEESHRRLAAAAAEATANQLQPREVSGRDAEMFLNGAYLVAAECETELRDAVAALERELGPRGARYEVTGPWPPFNFVDDPA